MRLLRLKLVAVKGLEVRPARRPIAVVTKGLDGRRPVVVGVGAARRPVPARRPRPSDRPPVARLVRVAVDRRLERRRPAGRLRPPGQGRPLGGA